MSTGADTVSEVLGATVDLVVFSIIFSYVFVGVQSLFVGLLMEFVVCRLATRKFHIVVSAAIMGLLSSAIYSTHLRLVLLLGFLIGFGLGLFLSHSFQEVESDYDSR